MGNFTPPTLSSMQSTRHANHQAIWKRDVGKGDLRTNLFGGRGGKHPVFFSTMPEFLTE